MQFEELLPARKTSKHSGIVWKPTDRSSGLLAITTDRNQSLYVISQFSTAWEGVAFHFHKASIGTDREEAGYDVFCARNGQDHSCTCKGFTRHGHCKHHDAAQALCDNGWLPDALFNAEQDVSSTEAPF